MPTTLKCCEAGSRVSPPYPVSPFSATFCRRTEASGGSGPYMGIFRIIIRSKIGVSKNYENYSFYNPRFLSPYMGLFLSQRWSVFIIVRSLFARVIKIAHCSFFSAFCAWTKSALVVYQRAISLRGNAGMSVQGQDFGALLYGVSYGVPPNFRKMALGVKLGDYVQNCPERG